MKKKQALNLKKLPQCQTGCDHAAYKAICKCCFCFTYIHHGRILLWILAERHREKGKDLRVRHWHLPLEVGQPAENSHLPLSVLLPLTVLCLGCKRPRPQEAVKGSSGSRRPQHWQHFSMAGHRGLHAFCSNWGPSGNSQWSYISTVSQKGKGRPHETTLQSSVSVVIK